MKITFQVINKRILLYLCMVTLGMYHVLAQDYNAFKKRLQEEEKKYRESVVCEKTTKAAVHNLNDLIWAKPNIDKIIKSCDFIRNQKNGCPQAELIALIGEIKAAYMAVSPSENRETTTNASIEEDAPVSNMPDTLISPEEEIKNPPKTAVTPIATSNTPYTIYGLLGLLTLFCVWLAYKVFQKPSIPIISYPSQSAQNMKNELLEKLGDEDLIAILKQMRDQIGVLIQKISSLEEDVHLLKQQQQAQELVKNTENETKIFIKKHVIEPEEHLRPKEDSTPIVNPPVSKSINDNFERRYALYMDNSEGFSVSGLMYAESAETIYEIIMTSMTVAAYRICTHPDAQAYALSDPGYYLRTACDYDNSPSSGNHIETLQDGQLEQIGSIWKITKKARIRFV